MKRIVVMTLLLVLAVAAMAQTGTDPDPKWDIFKFIGNADWINVGLFAAMSIGVIAGYIGMARTKMKQVGELLLLLYEYTDDKVLTKKEREVIWNKILVIIGKKRAEATHQEVKQKSASAFIKSKRLGPR